MNKKHLFLLKNPKIALCVVLMKKLKFLRRILNWNKSILVTTQLILKWLKKIINWRKEGPDFHLNLWKTWLSIIKTMTGVEFLLTISTYLIAMQAIYKLCMKNKKKKDIIKLRRNSKAPNLIFMKGTWILNKEKKY